MCKVTRTMTTHKAHFVLQGKVIATSQHTSYVDAAMSASYAAQSLFADRVVITSAHVRAEYEVIGNTLLPVAATDYAR
jgi:hypothetical protein